MTTMDTDIKELIERLVRAEAAVEEQTRGFRQCIERNDEAHANIMVAVNEGKEWRNRVQWSVSLGLLIVGMIVGFIITHIEWFWNILPMHSHTHGG